MNKEEIFDKKNGLTYHKEGDYYIPNLVAPNNIKNFKLGKYGRLRLNYLKQSKKAEYTILVMNNELQRHLIDIDKSSEERLHLIITQLAETEDITEELKASNQMEWVSRMNSIKNRAEEIIFKELIYV